MSVITFHEKNNVNKKPEHLYTNATCHKPGAIPNQITLIYCRTIKSQAYLLLINHRIIE